MTIWADIVTGTCGFKDHASEGFLLARAAFIIYYNKQFPNWPRDTCSIQNLSVNIILLDVGLAWLSCFNWLGSETTTGQRNWISIVLAIISCYFYYFFRPKYPTSNWPSWIKCYELHRPPVVALIASTQCVSFLLWENVDQSVLPGLYQEEIHIRAYSFHPSQFTEA